MCFGRLHVPGCNEHIRSTAVYSNVVMTCWYPAFRGLQRERTLEAFNSPGCVSQYRVPRAQGFKDHPTLGRIPECERIHQNQRLSKVFDCYLESIQIGSLLSSLD